MLDMRAFGAAIAQIEEEKGISKERILEAIEMAIAAAYKKDYGERGQDVRAKLNPKTGDLSLIQVKLVVDESMIRPDEEPAPEEGDEEDKRVRFNSEKHIMIDEAKKIKKTVKL